MKYLLTTLLSLFLLVSVVHAEETVLVTIKLVKTANAPADLPRTIHFPANCSDCKTIDDPAYERQNAREIILAMRIPRATFVDLQVDTESKAFERVLLETTDLSFERTSSGIHFTVPSQIADRPNSGEFQTHLYWQGVELRFEHGDPARRAGAYATGEFPAVQREAANNLEFGLLEAIRELGLDHYVDDQNLGRLFLMGFDTNYPHGHLDSPPHFHLALWLGNYRGTGSLIPHLYLTPEGLISHSLVGPYAGAGDLSNLDYKANQKFTAVDMLGRPVFSLILTPEGGLNFARNDGLQCSLRPLEQGFQSGIEVSCPPFPKKIIKVEDDLKAGEIKESVDGKISSVFHYDSANGALLQP
jgi:hypothetical protein